MKKFFCIIVVIILTFSITGCSSFKPGTYTNDLNQSYIFDTPNKDDVKYSSKNVERVGSYTEEDDSIIIKYTDNTESRLIIYKNYIIESEVISEVEGDYTISDDKVSGYFTYTYDRFDDTFKYYFNDDGTYKIEYNGRIDQSGTYTIEDDWIKDSHGSNYFIYNSNIILSTHNVYKRLGS